MLPEGSAPGICAVASERGKQPKDVMSARDSERTESLTRGLPE